MKLDGIYEGRPKQSEFKFSESKTHIFRAEECGFRSLLSVLEYLSLPVPIMVVTVMEPLKSIP